jgi:hypothetical protein
LASVRTAIAIAPAALEQGDLVDEVPERASPPAALEENPEGFKTLIRAQE